jgi:hypothetical protein
VIQIWRMQIASGSPSWRAQSQSEVRPSYTANAAPALLLLPPTRADVNLS